MYAVAHKGSIDICAVAIGHAPGKEIIVRRSADARVVAQVRQRPGFVATEHDGGMREGQREPHVPAHFGRGPAEMADFYETSIRRDVTSA